MKNAFEIAPRDSSRLFRAVRALADKRGCSISDVIDRLERSAGIFDVFPDAINFVRVSKRFRSRLKRQFGDLLTRDPAWDMLLDLLISDANGRRESISSLMYGAGVPATTGLRHLYRLEQCGFITRHDDECDQRRVFIELNKNRKSEIFQLLTEWHDNLLTMDIKPSNNRTPPTNSPNYRQKVHTSIHPVFLS